MKTLEELKQEVDNAQADCEAAWDAYAALAARDAARDAAAWDVWGAARDAYLTAWDAYKKRLELTDENT